MAIFGLILLAGFFIGYSVYLKIQVVDLDEANTMVTIELIKKDEEIKRWTNNYQTMHYQKRKFEKMVDEFGAGNPERMEKYLNNNK